MVKIVITLVSTTSATVISVTVAEAVVSTLAAVVSKKNFLQ